MPQGQHSLLFLSDVAVPQVIPRLKNMPHFRRADEIIFQPDIGVEFQVPDPEGQVQSLIDLLDGRRGLDEVHASMQRRWPELSFDDVRDGIESLGEAGLVENAAAGSTMTEIVGAVRRVSEVLGEITTAASEQAGGIQQVNAAVNSVDQMTQQNAALVEQSAAAAESMRDQAGKLARTVEQFRTA